MRVNAAAHTNSHPTTSVARSLHGGAFKFDLTVSKTSKSHHARHRRNGLMLLQPTQRCSRSNARLCIPMLRDCTRRHQHGQSRHACSKHRRFRKSPGSRQPARNTEPSTPPADGQRLASDGRRRRALWLEAVNSPLRCQAQASALSLHS